MTNLVALPIQKPSFSSSNIISVSVLLELKSWTDPPPEYLVINPLVTTPPNEDADRYVHL